MIARLNCFCAKSPKNNCCFCSFRNCVANVLLTSCVDNVCRIWCETLEQESKNDTPDDMSPSHCERHRFIPKSKYITHDVSTYDSADFQSSHHFHIAASIDPTKDIPVMSTVTYFTATENHSSFILHWVNNKEMFMTSVVNLLLGSPSVTVEAESAGSELSAGSEDMRDSPYVGVIAEEYGGETVLVEKGDGNYAYYGYNGGFMFVAIIYCHPNFIR